MVHILLKHVWRMLNISLLVCEMSAIVWQFEHSFGEGNENPLQYSCLENPMDGGAWWATADGSQRVGHDWAMSLSLWAFFGIVFLWDWNENWPFPVLWPLPSFPSLLAYWVQFFTASSFRVWNSSSVIPSHPMLPKAHFIFPSWMSSSRWLITPSWLSGLWRCFLYSSPPYSCYLFLISSTSVRSIQFLSSIVLIVAWNVPLVPLVFLKRSLVFPILLFPSISLH